MRPLTIFTGLVLTAVTAAGQQPDPPPSVIRVEVTEEIRMKADFIRIDMRVESRSDDPTTATDEVAAELKRVKQAFADLKIEGATLTPLPLRTFQIERQVRNPKGGPPGPTVMEYKVIRPIRVDVSETDFDKLTAKVEKVQTGLYTIGLKNDDDAGNPRTWYYGKEGWDGLESAALERAVKRGRAKADGMAAGAGVKVVGLASAEPLSFLAVDSTSSPTYQTSPATQPTPNGELTYRVRVQMEFTIRK